MTRACPTLTDPVVSVNRLPFHGGVGPYVHGFSPGGNYVYFTVTQSIDDGLFRAPWPALDPIEKLSFNVGSSAIMDHSGNFYAWNSSGDGPSHVNLIKIGPIGALSVLYSDSENGNSAFYRTVFHPQTGTLFALRSPGASPPLEKLYSFNVTTGARTLLHWNPGEAFDPGEGETSMCMTPDGALWVLSPGRDQIVRWGGTAWAYTAPLGLIVYGMIPTPDNTVLALIGPGGPFGFGGLIADQVIREVMPDMSVQSTQCTPRHDLDAAFYSYAEDATFWTDYGMRPQGDVVLFRGDYSLWQYPGRPSSRWAVGWH